MAEGITARGLLLAIKATEIFRNNKKYYDEDALAIVGKGFDPFDMPNLRFTGTTAESMKINQMRGSAVVIAGNGMCTAGRIKHHLKHNLWRPGASLILVGFHFLDCSPSAQPPEMVADRGNWERWVV